MHKIIREKAEGLVQMWSVGCDNGALLDGNVNKIFILFVALKRKIKNQKNFIDSKL